MNNLVKLAGDLAGFVGMAICLIAGIYRVTGHYHLAGFEAMTVFAAGVALMVAGCFLKLFLKPG